MKQIQDQIVNILNSSYDGIVITDRNGTIVFVNKAVERISNIPVENIVGKTTWELEEEGTIISQSKKILSKKPLTMTQQIKTGVEVFITSQPVYDRDGKIIYYMANYREMTELSRLQKELKETRNQSLNYYQEVEELRNRMLAQDSLVYKSKEMSTIVEKVIRVANSHANILIQGESGVGKEVVAKLIHNLSNRKDKPFIQINCGAIPANLLESELFGYAKGAFSGANKEGKKGLLELANHGVVFLDEIGDMPYSLQAKLLQAIQSQQFYRIGGVKKTTLDVHIISATNQNLEALVQENRFREDLFYRLNVIPLYITPLRERKADILPLAYSFLEKFNKKYETNKKFDKSCCDALEKYHWPGNVRELSNIVERMVITTHEKIISVEQLPSQIFERIESMQANDNIIPLKTARENIEKELILSALKLHNTVRKAAAALEIDHSTLIKKMQKYKITRPEGEKAHQE